MSIIENVIVGIDFSECSLNAMEHAVAIAAHTKAELTLLHVLSPDAKFVKEANAKVNDDLMTIVNNKMEELVKECQAATNANVKYVIKMGGRPFREINAEAEKQGNAMIVVGTHGSSGFEELFIGSSAFKIVGNSKFPVVTIRNESKVSPNLINILVLIDSSRETLQKLKYVVPLAAAFNAKVYILGIYTAKFKDLRALVDAYVKRAELYLTKNDIRLESSAIESNTRVENILKYAQEKNINIITMMKETELNGDALVLTSFNEKMVNRSPIPILTIPVDTSIYNPEI